MATTEQSYRSRSHTKDAQTGRETVEEKGQLQLQQRQGKRDKGANAEYIVPELRKFKKLIPPANYGQVEEDVYRSGEVTAVNLPFVAQLRLRSVLWLDPSPPNPDFQSFLQRSFIRLAHLPLAPTPNPWDAHTLNTLHAALTHLTTPSNLPILVSCRDGYPLTGLLVGCLRRLQGWNLSSVLEEYRRFSTGRAEVAGEVAVEAFRPGRWRCEGRELPRWLWLEDEEEGRVTDGAEKEKEKALDKGKDGGGKVESKGGV